MTYRWLIFDADNTLFDYDQAEKNALQKTFRIYGLRLTREIHQVFGRINGAIWSLFESGEVSSQRLRVQRFEQLAEELGLNINAESFSRDYLDQLGEEGCLVEGARQLVEDLAGPFHLALATNGIADVQQRRLKKAGLEGYFQAVVISDLIGVSKPSPAFFEEVFSRIGDPPREQVLMIGDSLTSDISGGAAFGMDTCWYNPAGQDAPRDIDITYQIQKLEELYPLLGANTAAEEQEGSSLT